jgi:hypothetical protein
MTVHRAFLSLVDTGQVRLEGVQGTIPSLTLASAAAHLATSLEHEGFTAVKVNLGAPVRITFLTEARLDGEVMSGGSSRVAVAANPGLSIEVVGRAGGK